MISMERRDCQLQSDAGLIALGRENTGVDWPRGGPDLRPPSGANASTRPRRFTLPRSSIRPIPSPPSLLTGADEVIE
jgi:hypothetical protein